MSTVNINTTNNTVSIQDTNQTISVTDNNRNTTVSIPQSNTTIVEVNTLGPQGASGPQGPQGPSGSSFPYTGSAVITGSLLVRGNQTISGSITVTNSVNATSLTGSLLGRASNATLADTANVSYELSLLHIDKSIPPTNSDIIIEYSATSYIGGIFYIRVENQTNLASTLYTFTAFNNSTAVTASYTPTLELPGIGGENTNDFVFNITLGSTVTLNGTNNSSTDTYNVNYYRLSYLPIPA